MALRASASAGAGETERVFTAGSMKSGLRVGGLCSAGPVGIEDRRRPGCRAGSDEFEDELLGFDEVDFQRAVSLVAVAVADMRADLHVAHHPRHLESPHVGG